MPPHLTFLFAILLILPAAGTRAVPSDTPLPDGVRVVWDTMKATRESTPTRERICLNGLWRWQPAGTKAVVPPLENWGFFKVPGSWPGITDYMQKDSQRVFSHSAWSATSLASVGAAWYQREVTIPREWSGRRVSLSLEYLNSSATVFVDNDKAGELQFPAGELDITRFLTPGSTHLVTMHVIAIPIKGVLLSYTDSAAAREVKGKVARRGLCGDVWLNCTPSGARLASVKVDTSVRDSQIAFTAKLENLAPGTRYTLRARIMDGAKLVKECMSPDFLSDDLQESRIAFKEQWLPPKLWDTHTPGNLYQAELSLFSSDGVRLDVQRAVSFGFREFWIDGRDFVLNGKRIHLSAVPLDNAQIGAALATYSAARETMERLKSFGINFVYTHNYDCEPGAHLSFAEILRAADDSGMLVALTQPHFSGYDWKAPDADVNNGYARHAAFYTHVADEHPSVVMYATSHNATGYEEDMNPDLIDGIHDPRDQWSTRNAGYARRAEAIIHRLDPGRIVYHHASGNLGSMHVMNFYPNMVPIQELSDWFGHWSAEGVKPAFMCEYGAPFTWDWTMYRGWYKGEREFGSAKVPWEFCLAEWNAQLFGDSAFNISDAEKANLRWEAKQFKAGALWHRWDYPVEVGSSRFEERYPVFARYITDNWRAFRTWGVSATSPWEYGHFWKLRDGVSKKRQDLAVDWDNLQRPGFSPDFSDQQFERMDIAWKREDWLATPAAEALTRNNRPLLAWIGGGGERFTEKDHQFLAGEAIEKQLILINDSRATVTCQAEWSCNVPGTSIGRSTVSVSAGGQERIPLRIELPSELTPGSYTISAKVAFDEGETQSDSFAFRVLPHPPAVQWRARIALFDPNGETRSMLERTALRWEEVERTSDLARYDVLVIGKGGLSTLEAAPDISRVRDGLKVLVFEQSAQVLEKRFGFRIAEYGLRQVFPRVPGHQALSGLKPENFCDWNGEATLQPPRLKYELRPRYGPTVEWSGIPVPRLWRCGNRGNVASVLIEKPARGDFLSLVDGGFGLQYSTLLEYREGRGVVVFCQTDVTGRTSVDPVAETLARNLLQYVADWKPATRRRVVYAGESAGKSYLEATGLSLRGLDEAPLSPDDILIAAPGSGAVLSARKEMLGDWLKAGGHLLALGLEQSEADAILPFKVTFKRAEHVASFFSPPAVNSLLAGIGPAEVHNRDPRVFPLVSEGARVLGDGVLAQSENGNTVFCQLLPWQFDPTQMNQRRTRRHVAVLVTRLLANMGAESATPLLERFQRPATPNEQRWLAGFYQDQPEEWDDPYRFFRW